MNSTRNLGAFIFASLLFACLFYSIHGFQFGDNNNREEVPLIYELITEDVLFPVDDFVIQHTNNYTQITPFLTFFSVLFQGSDLTIVKPIFLFLHFITLAVLFFILCLFLTRLYKTNIFLGATFILLISLISEKFIPAGRWLFINFFDPEWVTITILFAFIYTHIAKKYELATILMGIAGIMYPIYVIPFFPALIFLVYKNEYQQSKYGALRLIIGYATIPAIYSIFLWTISRQGAGQTFDASYVMEYIRAPWHYKIPSIYYMNKKAVGFFLLILPFVVVGRKLMQGKYWERSLYLLVIGILGTLLVTSVIHSIIRIPLLVQISPYRIGLFATAIAFLLLPALFMRLIKRVNPPNLNINQFIYLAAIFLSLGYLGFLLHQELNENELTNEVTETIDWIKENTKPNDLFANYSGIDVRTQAIRSSYFEFKTIPLTADGQLEWYNRFLRFNNQQAFFHPVDFQEHVIKGSPIAQFGVYQMDKFKALTKIEDSIAYLLTTAVDTATTKNHKAVFNNGSYAIFKVN